MFGIPFAIYYFHNSDAIKNGGVHCFANAVSQTPVSSKAAGAVDITHNFDEYIRDCFFLYLFSAVVYFMTFPLTKSLHDGVNSCTGCLKFILFITGAFLRWGHEGKVCSADYTTKTSESPYMHSTGSFLQIYLCFLIVFPCFVLCFAFIFTYFWMYVHFRNAVNLDNAPIELKEEKDGVEMN